MFFISQTHFAVDGSTCIRPIAPLLLFVFLFVILSIVRRIKNESKEKKQVVLGTAKEMLAFLGVYQGEINEYFDENMALAVSLVQKASGYLPQNGILDPKTQIELLKILSETEIEVDNQLEMAKQYFYVK